MSGALNAVNGAKAVTLAARPSFYPVKDGETYRGRCDRTTVTASETKAVAAMGAPLETE